MANAPRMSQDLRDFLYRGGTARQLSIGFGMDTATVERRLGSVRASGESDGRKLYRLKDASSVLAELPADVVGRVIRMGHADLPPNLRKEYFDGQLRQLKVLEHEGVIWRTDAVQRYVGESFRDIALEVRLIEDVLGRSTELTERQRQIVAQAIDSCLTGIRDKLTNLFTAMKADDAGRSALALLDPPAEPEPDDPWDGL